MSDLAELVARQLTAERRSDRTDTLQTPPFRIGASVYRSTNQSINDTTLTAITFDTVRWDYNPDGPMWAAGNPTRLTCVTPGRYLIAGNVSWGANATGTRGAMIRLGGTTLLADSRYPTVTTAAVPTRQCVTRIWELAAGQYVELWVIQTSGAPLNAAFEASGSIELQAWRLV